VGEKNETDFCLGYGKSVLFFFCLPGGTSTLVVHDLATASREDGRSVPATTFAPEAMVCRSS
jgi:hypothetical protein